MKKRKCKKRDIEKVDERKLGAMIKWKKKKVKERIWGKNEIKLDKKEEKERKRWEQIKKKRIEKRKREKKKKYQHWGRRVQREWARNKQVKRLNL